jgi:hypothetical protein
MSKRRSKISSSRGASLIECAMVTCLILGTSLGALMQFSMDFRRFMCQRVLPVAYESSNSGLSGKEIKGEWQLTLQGGKTATPICLIEKDGGAENLTPICMFIPTGDNPGCSF